MPVGLDNIQKLLPIRGIQLSACSAGIYNTERKDLSLISFNETANTVAVFTRNAFCAAPVVIAKEHLLSKQAKFCLINAGNANAGLGEKGIADAQSTCTKLAEYSNNSIECVLPFSTGVIAEPLPVEKINNAIPALVDNLKEDAWNDVADAIITTDTLAKGLSKQVETSDGTITITGVVKGSGMIRPDMATMLAFIGTDAKINAQSLQGLFNEIMEDSFNSINVDGDTSTNDACVLIATGESEAPELTTFDDGTGKLFKDALKEVCIYLAQAIVRDGEGATKFITVSVTEGKSEEECKQVALTIANSPLVKTAFFASDPNWGRVLAAVGRAEVESLDINKITVFLNDVKIVEHGARAESYTESKGQAVMNEEEITVTVSLARGNMSAKIWTCDLSHDYVRINSDYRS